MSALTFIAELVKTLAWPVTVMILVWLLRKPIRELVPLLTRLKYKDFEVEFGRHMAELKAEASEELPPREPVAAGVGEEGALNELAKLSPRAAITEAWRQVEVAALQAARRSDISLSPTEVTTTRVIRSLEQCRLIDAGKIALLHDLRGLRNQAAHAPDFAISTEAALDYIQLARRMREYLETAPGSETGRK